MPVIDQYIGKEFAYYQGDCVMTMGDLPPSIADFIVYSPPFKMLYIYSDSIADMGNTASDEEFFHSYEFALSQLYRTAKPGAYHAVHCKDLPAYMNSAGYFGLTDFPGEIIRRAALHGWIFQRWITVWKDPVIEMQRTKNHGLLWKNFSQRAEVTRQGMADFTLVFQKPFDAPESLQFDDSAAMPVISPDAIARARQLWSNEGEYYITDKASLNGKELKFSFFNHSLAAYTDEFISHLDRETKPGRSTVIRCQPLPMIDQNGNHAGYFDMAGEVITRFEQFNWRFRSRIALTDGTSLVVFTKWSEDMEDKQVYNKPSSGWYIGNMPPQYWDSDRDYSIQCWQKYASPVWFDLTGLPIGNDDIWFDINQTNVLNARIARENEDEKHICPLQLDLIRKLILEYTEPGQIVVSPFGGAGSEGYEAVKLSRKAILIELKKSYWKLGVRLLQEAELAKLQLDFMTV